MFNYELDNLNKNTIFLYIIITIAIILWFSRKNIGLNIIFGSIVAYLVIYYLYNRTKAEKIYNQEILDKKIDVLKPKSEIVNKYEDIVDYLFSIQDLYILNPASFQEAIYKLEHFFILYEEMFINNEMTMKHYDTLLILKREILNQIHSIVFSTENENLTNKINLLLEELSDILDKYIDNVKELHSKYLFETGINYQTKFIENNQIEEPLPKTNYDNISENGSFYSMKQIYTNDYF